MNANRFSEIFLNWTGSRLYSEDRPGPQRLLPPGREDTEGSLSLLGALIPPACSGLEKKSYSTFYFTYDRSNGVGKQHNTKESVAVRV